MQLEYDDEVFIFTRSAHEELNNLLPVEHFLMLQVLGEIYKNVVHRFH